MLIAHHKKTIINKKLIKLFLSILFCCFLAKNSFAQEEIIVLGADRVEDSTIISYFENLAKTVSDSHNIIDKKDTHLHNILDEATALV